MGRITNANPRSVRSITDPAVAGRIRNKKAWPVNVVSAPSSGNALLGRNPTYVIETTDPAEVDEHMDTINVYDFGSDTPPAGNIPNAEPVKVFCVSGVLEVLLLHDDMTDADTTLLSAHTPTPVDPGNPWVDAGPGGNEWQVLSNEASTTVSVANAWQNEGISIGVLSTTRVRGTVSTDNANGIIGIFLRSNDGGGRGPLTSNAWQVDAQGANAFLWEVNGGAGTFRGFLGGITTVLGNYVTLELEATGTEIQWRSITDTSEGTPFTSNLFASNPYVGISGTSGTTGVTILADDIMAWGAV